MAFVSQGLLPVRAPVGPAICTRLRAGSTGALSAADAAKRALLRELEDTETGRAVLADAKRQGEINAYIQKVEALNPTREPLASPDLSACWRLVYTDSNSILRGTSPAFAQPKADEILQTIDAPAGTVRNEEVIPLFGLNVKNQVRATFETSPPIRVNVRFREFQLGPLTIKAPETATGFLDITYLDKDMRISRGNKDSVFVLVKD